MKTDDDRRKRRTRQKGRAGTDSIKKQNKRIGEREPDDKSSRRWMRNKDKTKEKRERERERERKTEEERRTKKNPTRKAASSIVRFLIDDIVHPLPNHLRTRKRRIFDFS